MSKIHLEACPNCGSFLNEAVIEPRVEAEVRFCSSCQHPLMLVAGKYLLEGQLAEGGFGIIYKARHIRLQLDAKRVIKFIRQEIFQRVSVAERFAREVQITSYLSQRNEHIVRIFDDFGDVPKIGHYYVMEHLEGDTLAQRLESRGSLPLGEALAIFRQLASAMMAAHQSQVVHRDLKPENIFLIERNGSDHFVKVIDFGIAKPVDGDGQNLTKGALGTPEYMPPEQCATADVDERADIYSMAVILYEMIAGHTPFRLPHDTAPRSAMHILVAKLSGEPYSLNEHRKELGLSDAFDALLLKAMHKNPRERFQSVQEMLDALALLEQQNAFYANGTALPSSPTKQSSPSSVPLAPLSLAASSLSVGAMSSPLPTGELSSSHSGQFGPLSNVSLEAAPPSSLEQPLPSGYAHSSPHTPLSQVAAPQSAASHVTPLASGQGSLEKELFLPSQPPHASVTSSDVAMEAAYAEAALHFEEEASEERRGVPLLVMVFVSLLVVGSGVFGGMKFLAPTVSPRPSKVEPPKVPTERRFAVIPVAPRREVVPAKREPVVRMVEPRPLARVRRVRRKVRRRKMVRPLPRLVAAVAPARREAWSRCPMDGSKWMQIDVRGGAFDLSEKKDFLFVGKSYLCVRFPEGQGKGFTLIGDGFVPCPIRLTSYRPRRFARMKKTKGIDDDYPTNHCLK